MTWDWLKKCNELQEEHQPVLLVTVINEAGSTPRNAGSKMVVAKDGRFWGTIGGGALEKKVLEDCQNVFSTNQPEVLKYPLGLKTEQCCGGVNEIFVEPLNNGPRLYVFGAGHVGRAVATVFMGTPFVVHLIDEREEWIGAKEIPAGVVRHQKNWQEIVETLDWNKEKTYVAVMTHAHSTDEAIIEEIKDRPAKYIGLIGSQTKWESFKGRLSARGASPDELHRIRCPLGLNIGGKAPQEVAVSLASELIQIHYGRK